MDPAALAGLCALIARAQAVPAALAGTPCPPAATATLTPTTVPDGQILAQKIAALGARDGIARVAFSEAGNQGDSGLAAVVYTILNRLRDGRWGASVDAVLSAPSQFEPVMRAGGDWRRLPGVSVAEQARVDVILNLALEGRLPDLTQGARYFQNPAIVAARARAGAVSGSLVNFGGQTPSVVIGAHSFFTGRPSLARRGERPLNSGESNAPDRLFVGDQRRASVIDIPNAEAPADRPADPAAATRSGDPSRALFIAPDGHVSADPLGRRSPNPRPDRHSPGRLRLPAISALRSSIPRTRRAADRRVDPASMTLAGDPSRAVFIAPDGHVSADPR